MNRFARNLNPSMIVALVALLVALSGSAVAATLITSKQIKDGTIQARDNRSRRVLRSPGRLARPGRWVRQVRKGRMDRRVRDASAPDRFGTAMEVSSAASGLVPPQVFWAVTAP